MRRPFALAALLLCVHSSLHAQSMADRIRELFTFGRCGQPLCLEVGGDHGLHFIPSVTQGEHDLFGFLTGSIASSIASLPFPSATSGVTFKFEKAALVPTSISAGAVFAERAQTLGKGRLLTGLNVNRLDLTSIRGVSTRDLTLRFAHQNVGNAPLGDPVFENDVIEVNTNLKLDLTVSSIYATYGLLDNVDVGVLVPFVHVSLDGVSEAHVLPFATSTPHLFGTGTNLTQFADAASSGSSFGIGDVAVRIKAHLGQAKGLGFGVVADARLPTGDSANFLGSGAAAVRGIGIISGRMGNFSPHVNAGFVYRSGANQTNGFVGAFGFDHLMADKVTLAADILTDLQVGESKLVLPSPVIYTQPAPARRVDLTNIPIANKDNLVDASVGVKMMLPRDYLMIANLLFPLSDDGLRARYLLTVGFERTF